MVMTTYIYNPNAISNQAKYGKFVKTGSTYAFEFSDELRSLVSKTSLSYRNRTTISAWRLGEMPINDLLHHPKLITFTEDSHPEYFI